MSSRVTATAFVLGCGVLFSLGWGLRGYIGGGPLGAMIPGAFFALWVCHFFGIARERAALVAAFSAVGIGLGGEMTYGHTIGFLRSNDTLWWGLLGAGVKGGAWGLLGGAIAGMGFIAHRLTRQQLLLALGVLLFAIFLGVALINQPKLIYFSDPVNKPRDEIWAGLLFGAAAVLIVLRKFARGASADLLRIPLQFALWGLPSGVIGFGGGCALMAFGYRAEEPLHSLEWWKIMEFTFGACLGLAYGACAWRLRDALHPGPEAVAAPADSFSPLRAWLWSFLLAAVGLVFWTAFAEYLLGLAPNHALVKPIGMVLLGYSAFGAALLVLAQRSETFAWQTAITLTFVATIVDFQEEFVQLPAPWPAAVVRWGFVLIVTAAAVLLTLQWQRRGQSLRALLLGITWACVAVAFLRLPMDALAILPERAEDAGGFLARTCLELQRHCQVHSTFLLEAIAATFVLLWFKPESRAHE